MSTSAEQLNFTGQAFPNDPEKILALAEVAAQQTDRTPEPQSQAQQ